MRLLLLHLRVEALIPHFVVDTVNRCFCAHKARLSVSTSGCPARICCRHHHGLLLIVHPLLHLLYLSHRLLCSPPLPSPSHTEPVGAIAAGNIDYLHVTGHRVSSSSFLPRHDSTHPVAPNLHPYLKKYNLALSAPMAVENGKPKGGKESPVMNAQPSASTPASQRRGGRRRRSSATTTYAGWAMDKLLKVAVWYCIVTLAFRCPTTREDLTDASPKLCRPSLQAKEFVQPYVRPYYDQYLDPYVQKAQPYVDQVNERVCKPGYAAYQSAGIAGSRRALLRDRQAVPGACHCAWLSGG